MDLDEWELLPDDGFLEIHDDGGKKIFSRKYSAVQKNAFKMNYFDLCPQPSNPQKFVEFPESPRPRAPKQLVPLPIQELDPPSKFEKPPDQEPAVAKELTRVPMEIKIIQPAVSDKVKDPNLGAMESDQDIVSQVFFKKETEFVDMKMDSPKSAGSRGIVVFEDKGEAFAASEKGIEVEREMAATKKEVIWGENSNGGLNILKWSFTGIGAICSFGLAAASICVFILGTQHKNKGTNQNQKLRFQIYTDDKRIKQVVHHANKLNEAIAAVRGVPSTRANITVGGYYDGF